MTETTIETRFRRWRDERDPGDLAAVFDQAAPALLRLGQHVAPAGVEAEDLVQTTFLVALELPESWDDSRPLMPWLAGVLGRRAWEERRRVDRQPDRERLRVPTADDPLTASVGRETEALVGSALLQVPERYREILEGRLLLDCPAPELAARLGRSTSTVHVQLHRGMRLLRRVLPAGFAAGAAESATGLAEARRHVLHAARRQAAGSHAAPFGLFSAAGAIAAASLVLAAALVAFFGLRERGESTDSMARVEPAATTTPAPAATLARLAPSTVSSRTVIGGRSSDPVSDAPAAVPSTSEDEAATDGSSPVRWWVVGRVLAPAGVDHGKSAMKGTKVRIDGPGVGMEFGVVRPDGGFRAPMMSQPPWEALEIANARSAGEPIGDPAMTFKVTHPEYLPTERVVAFDERIGNTVSVELELGAAGRLRGRAIDDAGEDLKICFTQAYPLKRGELGAPAIGDRGFRFPSSYDMVAAPGMSVVVVGIGGLRPAGTEILVLEGTTHDLETVVLEGGASLTGIVRSPFEPGALVDIQLESAGPTQPLGPLEVTWHQGRVEWALARASLGADGSFEMTGLIPGGRYRVTCGDRTVTGVAGRAGIEL